MGGPTKMVRVENEALGQRVGVNQRLSEIVGIKIKYFRHAERA